MTRIYQPERVADRDGYSTGQIRIVIIDQDPATLILEISNIVEGWSVQSCLDIIAENGWNTAPVTHIKNGHSDISKLSGTIVEALLAALPAPVLPPENLEPVYSVGKAAMLTLQSTEQPDARSFAGAGPNCRSVELEDKKTGSGQTYILDREENTLHAYIFTDKGESLGFRADDSGHWDRIH